jgi:hypothetical protein
VTVGSNGECSLAFSPETGLSSCTPAQEAAASCAGKRTCLAAGGYDGPSGVGTPNGILGFKPGAEEPGVVEPVEPEEEAPPSSSSPSGPRIPVFHPNPLPPPGYVSPSPAPPAASSTAPLQITGLGLTTPALIALNRPRPMASKLSFVLTLNRPSTVRVTFARKVRVHGRSRWITIGRALSLHALGGRNGGRLGGRNRLVAGYYRLSAAATGASSRSIYLHIG